MDKNMIQIDELVRSRLQGGEEKERAGGWNAMQGLLDRELPTAVAATGNRRLYGLLLLLLIGTSLTVGGYQWATHGGPANSGTADNALLASSTNTPAAPGMASRRAAADEALNSVAKDHTAAAERVTDNTPAITSQRQVGAPRTDAHVATATSINNNVGTQGGSGAVAENVARVTTENATLATNRRLHSSNTNASGAQPLAVVMTPVAAGKGPSVSAVENSNIVAPATNSQVVTPDGLRLLLRRDSIQRIEIVQHLNRTTNGDIKTPASLINDTISMAMLTVYKPVAPAVAIAQPAVSPRRRAARNVQTGAVKSAPALAMNTPTPANTAPQAAVAQPAVVPAAALVAPSVADDGNSLVSLSSLTTSSVKHSWWNPAQFNEAVNKLKFKMGGIEWYGGLEAGINGSWGGGHSLGGFQCALTGLIAINEVLSVNTGLYFYQRYNTGSTVHDNYVEVDQNSVHYSPVIIGNISYNRYSWTEDSIDHHFNYDIMRTLELPILLRVSPGGRFFGEGGVNLVYGFKTAASEITNHAEQPSTQTQSYPTTQPDPQFGSQPTIKLDDFGSRFGVGFAVGGGYHFSPAVTLNLRVSKTVWDNAGTEGSKKVSTELFRLPSVQLSVGYRFSQQKASRPADR